MVELPPGVWGNLWGQIQRGAVLLRLAICALAAHSAADISRAVGIHRFRIG